MSSIPGVTDYHFEPGAGPVFVGGFAVTDFGIPVSNWLWVVRPAEVAPLWSDSDWSAVTVVRSGKTGILVMGSALPLAEGEWHIHVKYQNGTGERDIVRCARIFIETPH